jgi:hypothetical protein
VEWLESHHHVREQHSVDRCDYSGRYHNRRHSQRNGDQSLAGRWDVKLSELQDCSTQSGSHCYEPQPSFHNGRRRHVYAHRLRYELHFRLIGAVELGESDDGFCQRYAIDRHDLGTGYSVRGNGECRCL